MAYNIYLKRRGVTPRKKQQTNYIFRKQTTNLLFHSKPKISTVTLNVLISSLIMDNNDINKEIVVSRIVFFIRISKVLHSSLCLS